MKLITKYDLNISISNRHTLYLRYFSAAPFFLNGCIYFPYGKDIISCIKIFPNEEGIECNFVPPPEYQIAWPYDWKVFDYNGHAILSCEENKAGQGHGIFLDIDNNMEQIALPDKIREKNLCKTMVSETDDGILTNRIMHYKNSRSYQCLDFDGNLLWEEKHKAYRYTPFEERNGCVIFGTSGHGGGLYCYKISDGTCLCALDTKGTPAYCWYHDNIVCKNREGALIVMNPFENRILHEMKLDCRFTDNSGFFANERYICAVGFMKKTNSPCVCLFDMEMIN